jgi:CRISP-associated protein Cas1
MPSVFLITPGMCARLESEHMVVEAPDDDAVEGKILQNIPLRDVDKVVMTENVSFTIPLMAECMRREIPVIVTLRGERIVGLCLPPAPDSSARFAQYRRATEPGFALAIAVALVDAKISNSRRVLQRLAANRQETDIQDALACLERLAEACRKAGSVETVRGYEGTAAGRYFEVLGSFFPDTCPFERRSRRPPHNAVNAVLSFGYSLMCAEMQCGVHAAGLDPAIGFLHDMTERRPSLALDLIEPFRSPVADALALDLLSHGTLKPNEHFERHDGGVYLNAEGRKRFYVAYERRMTRTFASEQLNERTDMRREFLRMVHEVKRAVLEDDMLEPFAMN